VEVQEARTGQFTIGVGVNSDAGVTGQVILDERNFDATRIPTSWNDFANGTAFRGAGQGFRVEAIPGNQVQRYLVSFTEPYLFDTQVSLNLSGFFYDRRFFDWDEQRLGGRVGLGYRITPDLSFSTALRMENVNIHDPRVVGVPELDDVIGDNSLFSPRFTLTHDTRDIPFAPTEGHYIELAYEQVFGSFDYPRGEFDFRKYFLVTERPDGSGRHTLAYSMSLGFSGSQTPIFENFFAGGYSTLRGFDFRGASPVKNTVVVGGEFRMLGAVEYFFPLTADDMLKGVVFCDFGTVEEQIALHGDQYRVAPGFGLRIQVPALGPAPIALDLAVPVAHADTDNIQNFSFFFGFNRS
jgi:outer membrane protein insertion porin family